MLAAIFTYPALAQNTVVGPQPQTIEDAYIPIPSGVKLENWITGLKAPWSLVFLPDGRALVSERLGRIRLIRNGKLQRKPYAVFHKPDLKSNEVGASLNLFASGEGGLMGLAIHPQFRKNPYVYAMYTYRDMMGINNRIVRLRDDGAHGFFDRIILDSIPGAAFHNGGRIAFGPDGMLYATTGDIFARHSAQDLKSLAGKILRIYPNGSIPRDNPFPDSPIWSYGHRNPQGLAWHPVTAALFSSEHGPSGEIGFGAHDEINVIRKGRNHGWPVVVGAPGKPPYIDPIVMWASISTPPAGMTFYKGDLYIATLGSETLVRIVMDGLHVKTIERWFSKKFGPGILGRLRDTVEGPDGHLYILTSNRDGRGIPRIGDDKILRMKFSR